MNRKLLALLGASLLTVATMGTVASAADTAPPTTQNSKGQKREEVLQRIKAALAQLDLSAEQKTKIKSIFQDARTKLKALKGQTDAKTQAREVIQQARKNILAVLDDAQKAKLKEILAKDRAGSTN
jgi:Spy/CpxP family protein refolding chaperone